MRQKGQAWSLDYAVGLVIFFVAFAITSGALLNAAKNDEFSAVKGDAENLMNTIMSEGYPKNWDSTDVIRPGLISNNRLSIRKAKELANMSYEEISSILPSMSKFYISLTNNKGEPVAIGTKCGIGSDEMVVVMTNNKSYGTMAYYYRTGRSNNLMAYAISRNATAYHDNQILSMLSEAGNYDLIIIEDPSFYDIAAPRPNGTLTPEIITDAFSEAAEKGVVFVLTGDLGVPVLGANTTTNASNISFIENADEYFHITDFINVTTPHELIFPEDNGQLIGNPGGASHKKILVSDGPKTTAAKWQYDDSIIYYFPDSQGYYNGTKPLKDAIINGIGNLSVISEVSCEYEAPGDNTIMLERLALRKGDVWRIRLYAWR